MILWQGKGGPLSKAGKPKKGCEGFQRPSHRQPGRSGRRRALVLGFVHLLIAGHLLHWWITGSTLSPIEPSESMYTLENGEVNAGFIFFILAILSTAILGRWFCGWACHMVALQDLCAWMMKKIGITPRPFRSRLLGLIPFFLAFYMFLWPTVKRWTFPWLENVIPSWLDFFTPVQAWPGFSSHLFVVDFWSTFPSWIVAIPFFFICGFVVVYLLGAKGFCTYGCPYGAFFNAAERVSPLRIVADMSLCESCGLCTANCTSNVQISKEIKVHQQVVDPGCMKCLDCVDVCPNGVLSYGFGKPGILTDKKSSEARKVPRKSNLSWAGEISLSILFILSWLAWRGVYEQIPLLMATGIALSVTFLSWKLFQLLFEKDVSLQQQPLRRSGKYSIAGYVTIGLTILTLLGTASAGQTRWQMRQATLQMQAASVNLDDVLLPGRPPLPVKVQESALKAVSHLTSLLSWTRGGEALLEPSGTVLDERLGYMNAVAGQLDQARYWWDSALQQTLKRGHDLILRFGQLIEKTEGPGELALWLDRSREKWGLQPALVTLRGMLGQKQAIAAAQSGQPLAAARHLEALIPWVGENPGLLDDLQKLLEEGGETERAEAYRERIRQINLQN